jgi:hypothetical protein
MGSRRNCIAAIVLAAFGLSGCYPTWLTSRPKARIVVTDAVGAPLQGATVTLGTVEMHGIVGRQTRQDFLTDKSGRVQIKKKHRWAVQILLPDGDVGYSWSLCVARPGFLAVAFIAPEFEEPIHIPLAPSAVKSECHWPKEQMSPQVIEWKPGRWIEVEGGVWTPDNATMTAIAASIQGIAESSAQGIRRELRPWSEYLFQYQGRMTGSTPWVYIKALCQTPPEGNVDSCTFEMTYDAKRGRFDSFDMNSAVTDPTPSR